MNLHNVFLTLFAESGFFGLVLYVTCIGLVLRKAHRVQRRYRNFAPTQPQLCASWSMA